MPYLIVFIVLAALALVYAHFVEPGLLTVRTYRVQFDERRLQIRKGGHETGSKKICFFSDLHAGPFFCKRRLERVVRRIRACAPDLILCGGDLVTEESDVAGQAFKDELIQFFASLTALAPVVAVFGNHDAEDDRNRRLTEEIYRAAGVRLLSNEQFDPEGMPLSVFGTEEGYFGRPKEVPEGFSGILLCHQPDLVPGLTANGGAILGLSGHTHRGQVTLAGLPLVKVNLGRLFTYGLYIFNEAQALLVTGGIGMVHLPFRFWALPEIVSLSVSYRNFEAADTLD